MGNKHGSEVEVHVIALLLLAPESRGDSAAGASVTRWLETVRAVSSGYAVGALWFQEPGCAGGAGASVVDSALQATGRETTQAVIKALSVLCPSAGRGGCTSTTLLSYTSRLKSGELKGPGEYRTPLKGKRRWHDQARKVYLAPRVQRLISSQRAALVAALQRGLEQAQADAVRRGRKPGELADSAKKPEVKAALFVARESVSSLTGELESARAELAAEEHQRAALIATVARVRAARQAEVNKRVERRAATLQRRADAAK